MLQVEGSGGHGAPKKRLITVLYMNIYVLSICHPAKVGVTAIR